MTRQLEDCRALAARLGWTVVGEYVDNDVSAYSGKVRPEYTALLRKLETGGIGGVLAFHTDRLHRSPRELEHYIDLSERHGVLTHTVKAGPVDLSTPSGRAVARTLGAWARHESEQNSMRTRRALLQRAQRGQRAGGPIPFGYALEDGKPVIVEKDASEVRGAYAGILAGRSIGSIVKDLNARGVKTGRGGEWTSTSVRNLILRPANAGLVKHQGKVMEGVTSDYPPIVSEHIWRAAVSVVSDPSRRSHREDAVRHLLSGLVRCGGCGEPMRITARARSQRGDSGRFLYVCRRKGPGPHVAQSAEPLEEYVSEVVAGYLELEAVAEGLARREAPESDTGALRAEEKALQERLTGAADMFAAGTITGGQLETITATARGRLAEVQEELARAQGVGSLAGIAGPGAAGRWEATDLEGRRAIIDALVSVSIAPVGKARPRVFDPSRVTFEWKI
ncbi:recombinase family protein [Kocuria rosea]|uniref:recombinase family protein n=1 Tax=Kocuria rosea TaxID=1275 RepID=UPI002B254211|nr:recombinase family protein [Kocuria rosea]MEB2527822.1 recombinase family protein [Kocuria rosea]MEB2617728.1 recombinase family protein [Kocuria rosea]